MEARILAYPDRQREFAATHWSVVRACVGDDTVATGAREQLCRDYWYPVYVHLRRSGYQHCDAEDLTQDFFAHVLSRPWFVRVDKDQGKFRSFMLTSLNRFVRDQLDRRSAFKRGGGHVHVPLDMSGADSRYAQSRASQESATNSYEVEWTMAIVAKVLRQLEAEYVTDGKGSEHENLKLFLTTEGNATHYEAVAQELEKTVENVRVCVHRLRKRYAALLKEEVARTVSTPEDVDGEMRHMRQVLSAVGG